MSMRWLTILQFLEIFAAYGIVTLFLPWRILGKRFHRFSVAEQLIAYFFAGNFYIIYLVYLLQFLRISSRVTLLLGTVFSGKTKAMAACAAGNSSAAGGNCSDHVCVWTEHGGNVRLQSK